MLHEQVHTWRFQRQPLLVTGAGASIRPGGAETRGRAAGPCQEPRVLSAHACGWPDSGPCGWRTDVRASQSPASASEASLTGAPSPSQACRPPPCGDQLLSLLLQISDRDALTRLAPTPKSLPILKSAEQEPSRQTPSCFVRLTGNRWGQGQRPGICLGTWLTAHGFGHFPPTVLFDIRNSVLWWPCSV